MTTLTTSSAFDSRNANRLLGASAILLGLIGLLRAESAELFAAYMLVVAAAMVPSLLWLRFGATGVPVLPAAALAYIPYFALPVISGNESLAAYAPSEVVVAAATVVLFLTAATIAWRLLVATTGARYASRAVALDDSGVVRLIAAGLVIGMLFHGALVSGWLASLGPFFGVVRSAAITLCSIACFLAGVSRAHGRLHGGPWIAVIIAIALIVVMAWSSLFLVGGLVYLLAGAMGYMVVARRVPWALAAASLVTITVLHAGKAEMRQKYWMQESNYGGVSSMAQLPGLAAEWVGAGISAITAGDIEQNALDRASLLQMLLRAQRDTPQYIDYLKGETYAHLPEILVPRFIAPDKPPSQVAMTLLNIHYGILTAEEADVTAIGWGLVAEAYANFGYYGVVAIAVFLGLGCGVLSQWSANASITSLPALIGIATMVPLINLEADFIQLFLTLLQSYASLFVLVATYKGLVAYRQRTTPERDDGVAA